MNQPARRKSKKRKVPNWLLRTAGFVLIKLMTAWMNTLHMRMWRQAANADPGDDAFAGPALYIFWHEYIPLPIYIRPNCRLTMLLSQHGDAEVLSHVAGYAGMQVVRGSTFRGGSLALRKLLDSSPDMSLAIVPDGPRGPRRQVAQGCVYVSSRMQIPIVALGIAYERPWRVRRAWDKFAIPRPFSRCRVVVSPRIQVPTNLSREELEQHRLWIQQQLLGLTQLAEDWAEGRCSLPGNEALYRHGPGHLKNAPQRLPQIDDYPIQLPDATVDNMADRSVANTRQDMETIDGRCEVRHAG